MVVRMMGALGVMGVVVAVAFATACGGVRERVPDAAALVGVLVAGSPSTVQVYRGVDGGTVGSYRLRSPAYDIAADNSTGTFVTAQSGGVGADSDRRLGVIEPRRSDRVRYVVLPWPNPWLVATLPGSAYVAHGVVADGGLRLSTVDLSSRSVADTGLVPDGTGDLAEVSGRLLVSYARALPEDTAEAPRDAVLGQLDSKGLEVANVVDGMVPGGGIVVNDPAAPAGAPSVLVVGSRVLGKARAATVEVSRVDLGSGRVTQRTTVDGLSLGVGGAAAAAHRVALIDADESGDSAGGAGVLVLDASSLAPVGRLPLHGGCAAIGASGDLFFVADAGANRVVAHDARSLERRWWAPLQGNPVALSIAVLGPQR